MAESKLPFAILFVLLAIVALRLTITEIPVQEFISFTQDIMPAKDSPPLPPEPGPATIACLSLLTLLLAGLAAFCCRISRAAWVLLAMIVAILSLAVVSTFHAANNFNALVGTFDLAMGLFAGWAVMLLATTEQRRRLVIAVFAAVLTAWIAKGLYQRLSEIPDTIEYYNQHTAEIWKEHGWKPGDFHIKLFEGRMNSKEVSGFSPFSNVFAEGLMALSLLALALTAANAAVKAKWDSREVPPTIVYAALAGLVFLLSGIVLVLTQSKGACAAAVVFSALFLAGLHYHSALQRRWKMICVIVLAVWIMGAAGVVAYGLRHDALPSRSLLFRWHYWTASVPIIKSSPATGVGLNNFGSYYLMYKRPSSPEDVKDPHNFFVRIAAELGLPSAALFALMLIYWFYASARELSLSPYPGIAPAGPALRTAPAGPSFAVAILFTALWWTARVILNERLDASVIFDFLFAAFALGGFLLADATARAVAGSTRISQFAILTGALGMMLYDQINVGLVTGSLAMFFWICLGFTAARAAPMPASPKTTSRLPWSQKSVGALLGMTALGLAVTVLIPIAQDTHPWDPRVPERQWVAQIMERTTFDELPLLNAALGRDPLSVELLHRRIAIEASRGVAVSDDIRHILALDPFDISMRVELAQLVSDWPAAERLASLRTALELNDQLEAGEAKRLNDDQRREIKMKIAELQRAIK
jgi:hypothetical protein